MTATKHLRAREMHEIDAAFQPPPENVARNSWSISDDRAAIEMLVAQLDDAVNRRDLGDFGSLWTPDAVWEIAEPRPMRVEGAQAIGQAWERTIAGTEWLFRGSSERMAYAEHAQRAGRRHCTEAGTFHANAGYDNCPVHEDLNADAEGQWLFRPRRYLCLGLSSGPPLGSAVFLANEPLQ